MSTSAAPPPARMGHWWTTRAVVAHLALAVWVPGCAVAAWWQVGIALGGDSLGWVYSVMWPCFALFGAVFWWFLVHDDPETLGARGLRRQRDVAAVSAPAAPAAPAVAAAPAAGILIEAGVPGDASAVSGTPTDEAIARAEAEDPELAAYNAYLAELARQPVSKGWRRR